MDFSWYITGTSVDQYDTEGDSYLGRAQAQHRAAAPGQKGAAGGLVGGAVWGSTHGNHMEKLGKNHGKHMEKTIENRRLLCRMYH